MATYMIQVSYTPEAWAALLKNPQDRTTVIEGVVKNLGGKMEKFYMSFGEYDIVGVVDMPDSVSAAAFSLAVSAGGACRNVKTTQLLTTAEGVEAMRKAAASGYKPVASRATA